MSEIAEKPKKEVKAKAGTFTSKVETVIGSGAKALQKAALEATKVLTEVNKAVELAGQLTDEVAAKKAELDGLEVQYAEKERQLTLDVDLQVQEAKGKAIDKFLKDLNQVAVETDEYNALQNENTKLKGEFKTAVATETATIRASEAASYTNKLALAAAEAKGTNAEQAAQLATAKEQVLFYAKQVQALTEQLTAERNARVEEAKARGVAAVTVNNGK